MTTEKDNAQVEELLDDANLATALESDRFKHFLDHVPVAVAVSDLQHSECITYANLQFEQLTGHRAAEIEGKHWSVLHGKVTASDDGSQLCDAIATGDDYIGAFKIEHEGQEIAVDAWSNIIHDEDDKPVVRLVALAKVAQRHNEHETELEQRIRTTDTLLRELQHRVKNNLQMITALIRLEARNLPEDATAERFARLAGRIDSLALLYRSLSEGDPTESVDLGIYLSEVASAVMRAQAGEGIHLDLKVDTWPVSVNVAMPTGLVVNELLTNALKHAFVEGEGGTISLHSLVDDTGCWVTVSDDGIGLAEGAVWPKPGKLSALIVQSLKQNAHAQLEVISNPGEGMQVRIFFARADAGEPA